MIRAVLLAVLLAGCTPASPRTSSPSPSVSSSTTPSSPSPSPSSAPARPRLPLAGVTIAVDPGHQLGNHNFPRETGRLVEAGGFVKPCNTTGTATSDGWPEATFTWELAQEVRRRLAALGARVELTRTANSEQQWGPCVDARGGFAASVGADLMVSLHADGAPVAERGFHVIVVPGRPRALALAEALRSSLEEGGLPRSSYVSEGMSLRHDLGTLNLATVPAVMLELGNMANPDDAALMRSAEGRATCAAGVVRGIRAFLRR